MKTNKACHILDKLTTIYNPQSKLDINWKGDIVNRTSYLGKKWRDLKNIFGGVDKDVKTRISECFRAIEPDQEKKAVYNELKTHLEYAKLYSEEETKKKTKREEKTSSVIAPIIHPNKLNLPASTQKSQKEDQIIASMEELKQMGNQKKNGFILQSGKSSFYLQDEAAYAKKGGISVSLGNDGKLYINHASSKDFGERTLNAAEQLVGLVHANAAFPKSVSDERIKAAHLALKLSCSRLADGKTDDVGHYIKPGGENRTLAIANLTDALIKFAATGNPDEKIDVLYRSGQFGGELPGDVKETFNRALTEEGEILQDIEYLKKQKKPEEKVLQKDLEETVQFLKEFPGTPFKPIEKPTLAVVQPSITPNELFFKPTAFQEFQPIGDISQPLDTRNISITRKGNTTLINEVPYEKCTVPEQKAAYQLLLLTRQGSLNTEKIDAASHALSLAIAMRPTKKTLKDGKEITLDPSTMGWGNSKNSRHEVSNVYRALMQYAHNENLEELIDDASSVDVQKIKIKDLFSRITKEDSDFRESVKNSNLPRELLDPMKNALRFAEGVQKTSDQKFNNRIRNMTFEDCWNLGRYEQNELDPLRDQTAARLNEIYGSFFDNQSFSSSTQDKDRLLIRLNCTFKEAQKIKGFPFIVESDKIVYAPPIIPKNWDRFKTLLTTTYQTQKAFTQAAPVLRDHPTYYQSKDGKYVFGKTVKDQQTIIYIKDILAETNKPGGIALSFNMTTKAFWKNGEETEPTEADLNILETYLDPDSIKESGLLGQ